MEHKIYYLYLITDVINNKIYVGQTVRPNRRWNDHKWLSGKKHEQYIHRAMNKYGIENFIYEVIACCKSLEDANETEMQLIDQYNTRNKDSGYNVAPGGALPAWNVGLPKEQQPMYGKKQSSFQKQRMSEIHGGSTKPLHTDEWKQQASLWLTGRPVSLETRKKISEGNVGKTRSLETRNRTSKARTGLFSGEKHPRATLTNTLVVQIRKEYATGEVTQRFLAKKYSVSQTTIGEIVRNEIYKVTS